jgi:hypothetical protein
MRRILLAAVLAVPTIVMAQSYRCVGADGKKYYGQSVPPQCVGQVVEQLNAQGMVVKKFDAQASAEERAKKDAEAADRKKREAVSKEEGRRDRALLATYTSTHDIEQARDRALKDNQAAVTDLEKRIATMKQSKAGEGEIKVQEEMLATKKKEGEAINQRYADDRKRYVELTTKK